jgi:hypothetical protein
MAKQKGNKNAALDRLSVFIGRWTTEGKTVATPQAPWVRILASITCSTNSSSGFTRVIVGRGELLFREGEKTNLKLIAQRTLATDVIVASYRPVTI